ncbi:MULTISPECIES: hypothetical protein [Lysinibacillus]|uniref:hypothetical protein n=1 Tax=Lysinibacillus TaxID=400634 RepID=UPI00214C8726|nr:MULTISPECIES: hypothetical protein [Lysinibacillus]UUV25936.1 hypothetical protein NP781_04770 [Lysinibacillus sp. FN11]UYB48809.1 hypothetical protein OCI51_07560 [Lysinibacillus capsici]
MKVGLFSFVRITYTNHQHFGRTGQITDYDTFDKEYIMHFDKISKQGTVVWRAESTRVQPDQVRCISKCELEKSSEEYNDEKPEEMIFKQLKLMKSKGWDEYVEGMLYVMDMLNIKIKEIN